MLKSTVSPIETLAIMAVAMLIGKPIQPIVPITSTIGYHIRHGKHAVLDSDWQRYMNFADRHFKR